MEIAISRLGIQVVVAIVCAILAHTIIPRRIPGHIVGLTLVGLFGVWLGEWLIGYLGELYNLKQFSILHWDIQQVRIIPAVVGCVLILYVLQLFLQWGRYDR